MVLTNFIIILYLVIGIVLAFYWIDTEYAEEYKKSVYNANEETAMTCILMLLLALFWPPKVIYKGYKRFICP